jgi:hypothetical protein
MNMNFKKQYYVVSRSSVQSKPVESEYQTEAEALEEAIRLLKRGDLVEMGEEFAGGF